MDELTATPRISLKDTEETKCSSCGHNLFKQAITIRKISPILSGTGRDEYVPAAVIVCAKCDAPFEAPRLVAG